ncbi:carbon-nitrogen hydrolase family protein [Paraburkholderia silvatlantica]|uniref:Aliphatic nitrilase n=1 Tax=Paraburkholderia silvatlantica TaxID=321895 RepID=A0ABR6FLH6_9BURK|nr:carbon-nitrogen hydrolase family protein [Paraburkholderia silvatlantica]MBB2927898.1 aliphatic nitrilase [Paraburkholderia silvatlantica]PVY27539.1 aliphatic nitrilase [Paraburkholderia silvatlantica]PXW34512.1 aliphatic nitrilase [Paraburkholderia silvatlantica]
MSTLPTVKVAAVHAAPVFLNKRATVAKAVSLIREASRNGAQLIAFPESYIPAFPVWASLWAPIDNHDLFERFAHESLYADGSELAEIAAEAQRNGVFVSMGFSERSHASVGCLWNSNVMIDDRGEVQNLHRKLVPTFYEKLVWAAGDGAGLQVVDTRIGRVGGLICGENTNPLARYSLIAQGEQIHISSWPALWPTRRPVTGGNFDNVAANRLRAGAHSFEAKAFGIICAGYMDAGMRDFLVDRDSVAAAVLDGSPRAVTMFVDPTGTAIGDSLSDEEGIAYAEFDLNRCIEPKQFHDVVGYYNRFDVFSLNVDRTRLEPVSWRSSLQHLSPQLTPEPVSADD